MRFSSTFDGAPVTRFVALGAIVGCLTWSGAVQAETLKVGATQTYKMPSAAAAVAKNGDTIEIEPGEYFDCAVWNADNLTITGKGAGVIVTDKTCQGKALFVIVGSNTTVRNLTLTRAVVPDGNGAGIRAEGANLKIENVQFIKNQDGILAADNAKSTIEIDHSTFNQNGSCPTGQGCAHGIYINHVALLKVTNSTFFESKDAHHIKTRAIRSEIVGNKITDGPKGNSSYLIDVPNGGGLVVENNVLEKGPNTSNHSAAIVIGAEGVTQRTDEIVIKDNKFTNDYSGETRFVRNLTATSAMLTGNSLSGKVVPLDGDGEVH
ncbi:right-handed parallel beta-helix repeat-containing protein [Telmatospirillum sp.]|uniref:right-handed parallel beta-helix repeat-containing protein n=1 Tax=Telmatospirillum sp. TaxID=2079197 RepID=UPI00284CD82E|nr:right-handed parallel beta-helix repeat-containing protein [Telmatospirillum sp.]MDR3439935.1 right-handed parallel beta-helix repeat-containing protein [Telmatospirillum sp.]